MPTKKEIADTLGPVERFCVAVGCINPAKGHFCPTCWKKLPWDIVAAITTARKTGRHRVEVVKRARDYLESQPKEDVNADARSWD